MSMLMPPPLLTLTHFAAETFAAGLWQGLLLAAVAALALRLLPQIAASFRFAVWALTFILSLALPLLRLPFHRAATLVALPATSVPLHLNLAWSFAIVALWMAVAFTRASQLLAQTVNLRRLWRRAVPVIREGSDSRRLRAGSRTAQLCTSTDVDSPSVIGFFYPRLLIPASMYMELSEQELNQLVLHECAHLKRGDDWSNLLQKFALVVFPLNPAAFWLDRRLSLERELACDAAVVRSTAAPTTYARCLTRLAEHRLRCKGFALALSARGRQSELAQRIQILLSPAHTSSSLQAGTSFAVLAAVLAGSSLAVAHAPQLVSFAKAAPALQQQASLAPRQNHASFPVQRSPVAVAERSIAERVDARTVASGRHTQPKPALASAVFVSPPANSGMSPFNPGQRRLSQTRVRMMSALSNASEPRMVPATQSVLKKSHSRPTRVSATPAVYTVTNEFSSSYAAVPFGDGWLIIQL